MGFNAVLSTLKLFAGFEGVATLTSKAVLTILAEWGLSLDDLTSVWFVDQTV